MGPSRYRRPPPLGPRPLVCCHSQASPNCSGVQSLNGRPSSIINRSLFCPILASNCFMSATLLGPKHPINPMARATPRTHRGRRATHLLWLFAYLPACSSRKNPLAFLPCMIWINIDCFMTQDKALLSFIASKYLPLNIMGDTFNILGELQKAPSSSSFPLLLSRSRSSRQMLHPSWLHPPHAPWLHNPIHKRNDFERSLNRGTMPPHQSLFVGWWRAVEWALAKNTTNPMEVKPQGSQWPEHVFTHAQAEQAVTRSGCSLREGSTTPRMGRA